MGKILIITGPSGIGKTYLAQQLVLKYPAQFEQVQLFTTRAARKNETLTDRIHIPIAEFLGKKQQGDFIVAERFHGNWYGYEKSALHSGEKIIVFNAWPALITRFTNMPNVHMLGLTVQAPNINLLKQRMAKRGDSIKTIEERLELIQKDIKDLEAVQSIVNKYGKTFTVIDDATIPQDVIPWVESILIRD